MADWRSYFKGKYLNGPILTEPTTATISRIEATLIEDPDGGEARERMVVHFHGPLLPWIPCKTTGACVAAMYGDDADGWVGKPVTLYHDPTVKVGREVKGGVRVKGAPGINPVVVTVKLPRRKAMKIRLVDTAPGPALVLEDVIGNLTRVDVDRWLTSRGKQPISDEHAPALAAHLKANPNLIDAIRAMVPNETTGREPGEEG